MGCFLNMFTGAKQVVIVDFHTSLGLVFSMVLGAIGVSDIAAVPLFTSVLAFAPEGVAEMERHQSHFMQMPPLL